MGTAVEKLTDLVDSKDRYSIPWAELLPTQINASNELLSERAGAIKLLANRAQESGLKEVRALEDLVPLLFAHTAYKSYPENWFTQGKWDRMGLWLDSLTTHRIPKIDTSTIDGIDEWVKRLDVLGHYLCCSSGTTGKCSIIPSSMKDRTFFKRNQVACFAWSTGLEPRRQYKIVSLTPIAKNARNEDATRCILDAFGYLARPFPGEPITVGQVTQMVRLRRSIADGTARPTDSAGYEATVAAREKMITDGLQSTAEVLVASRGEKLLINGMAATMFQISETVRNMGYAADDFDPDNALMTGGGLKGAKLPADYRERIFETFNVRPERSFQFYGMQETNTMMPRCRADRYHVPPWLILLVLDQTGDRMLPLGKGVIEGRAGFMDLSIDGRWGGLISGDKVRVDYGQCACGHQGPTVDKEIVRYADLADGDRISCAGTIDAYVRGIA